MKKKLPLANLPLAIQILIALFLGILAGMLMKGNPEFAWTYIRPFGTIFLNLVQFIIVPIVLFSIMDGIVSMKDIHKVGSIGVKTVVYYLFTTAAAIVIGLVCGSLFRPLFPTLETADLVYEAPAFDLMGTITNIFPSNFLSPLLSPNMLQVIVMAIFLGISMIALKEKSEPVVVLVHSLNSVFINCMEMILRFSPIGVFCLITPVIAENGSEIIGSLTAVLSAMYIAFAIHMFGVYSCTVSVLGRMNPVKFFKTMMPAILFAFSSASSVGTLPINLECCEKMGAERDIVSFVLPLGATINMDGTAIYQGVCAIFIASCYGITLTSSQIITIILTATLASIGTAGVPGAGMVMLAMVLSSVGLPVEGIALVAGIDRIFDMGRTVVNITGDASCAVIVSRSEKRKAEKKSETK